MANPRIDDLRRRLEREPGSRLFAQLAEELRKEGELEEAIQVSRDGLQRNPNYPSARMTLGRALLDTGDLASARIEFEAVLKGAPDNILASRFLGECLEGLGDLEGAAARYKATLALAPGDRQVLTRLEGLEANLRKPSGGATAPMPPVMAPRAAAPAEPPPIPVVEVDEPMVLESAHEAPPVRTGDIASFERPAPKAPPGWGVTHEESFEVERPAEAPAPIAWKPEVYIPATEVVFEEEIPAASPEAEETLVEAEPERQPEPQPPPLSPPVPEPATVEPERPPLSSSTLAELYFNQGFVDKSVEVYRQLLEREPGNERARARLAEVEALDRHLRSDAGGAAPAAAPVPAVVPAPSAAPEVAAPAAPAPEKEDDQRARRREAIERTIQRLESFLAAVRRE